MNSNTRGNKGEMAAINSLVSAGKTNTKSVEDFVNRELADVIKKRKLKRIEIKRAIFSHLEKGLVISGPVSLPEDLTRSDLRKKTHPVGFLINTLRLVDPVSRRALQPGVSLVEKRPLRGGDFAFDYVGGDGKVKMATDTHQTHPFGNRSDLSDPGGSQPTAGRHYDIEVNHVIVAPTVDDMLPCPTVCTSFSDGTEKCHYACGDDDDLGFTIE